MAFDRYGRRIHYLRISLTDRCNLRCQYCMPEEMSFRPSAELMQDDEILTLVRLFAGLGIDKIRLTGGEPTVRANIVDLVDAIAHTPGIRSVSMTTNGLLFGRLAGKLKQAGLQRANFSLDTLDPEKYRRLTRLGTIERFWDGLRAAEDAGLLPVKINTVVARDHNDEDVVEMARLTIDNPWHIRFIEMMPFAGATDFQRSWVVTSAETQARIEDALGPLEPVNGGRLDGEARLFRFPQGKGVVGFISTVSQPFCASCTRIRLTSDGRLRLCLLREYEVDLLTPMRAGATLDELRSLVVEGIWNKPWGNRLAEGEIPMNRTMSQIGG